MKTYSGMEESDRMERVLMRLSLIGLLLCLLLLVDERVYHFVFGAKSENTKAAVIGRITFAKNDIRHRSSVSISWEKAKSEQKIRTGDSVFTGSASQLQVRLKDGGTVELGQNSLVRFSRAHGLEVPNLALGNFRLSVNGKMTVAIDGEVTEIEGADSEVQVEVRKNEKPRLRLLKGAASVGAGPHSRRLVQGQMVPAFVKPASSSERNVATAGAALKLHPLSEVHVHLAEVYDLYERPDQQLRPRPEVKDVLEKSVPVSWEGLPPNTAVYGQLSRESDFKSVIDSFSTQASGALFKRSLRGRNFVRLSLDGKNWVNHEFNVEIETIPMKPPDLKFESSRLYLLDGPVVVKAKMESPFTHHLIEISDDPDFSKSKTKVLWTSTPNLEITLSEPQVVFVRLRGVNEKQQVTDLSQVHRIEVQKPLLPMVPKLAMKSFEVFQNEELLLSWSNSMNAESYRVEVTTEKGKTLLTKVTSQSALLFPTEELGRFQVKVTAKDRFGRLSEGSARAQVEVKPGLPLRLATTPENLDSPQSTPLSAVTQKISSLVPDFLNKNYRSSKLQVEGAAFTMYSQDQVSSGEKNPTALMLGLRWLRWMDSQGVEGLFKSKVVDVQNDGGSEVSPFQIEARYRYRWNISLSPFSKLGQSEFSLIGGYEYYKNGGRGLFSPGYSLLKSGFSLAFPMSYRWDIGGEVLYGLGMDSSHKYEISGYFNRFFDPQWSFGFGYRIHLFEAGATAASAVGLLPYREGYGEGYSVLRWHY